jgi:hypothetical protein
MHTQCAKQYMKAWQKCSQLIKFAGQLSVLADL